MTHADGLPAPPGGSRPLPPPGIPGRVATAGRKDAPVSPELIAILAVGVGLAGLMWQSMRRMEARLEARIDGVKGALDEAKREFGARIDGLAEEMRGVRDRLGRLEGKMDFVHDYIMRRNDPAPAAE